MADHVLLTRFNLPSVGAEGVIRASPGWLENRVELFERYCLPSVKSQTITSFGWLVYFDPESPEWLKSRITYWSTQSPLKAAFRPTVSRTELLDDIERHIGRSNDVLITTNLDNDDALARNFVQRIQAAPTTEDARCVIYLTNGLILNGDKLFSRKDSTNAFCSVREPWADARTCWSDWHNLLPQSMPSLELKGEPGWLQVVHGKNVTNRVRGKLIDGSRSTHLFPGLLSGTELVTQGAIVRDQVLHAPVRLTKEGARQAVKWAILNTIGKRGLVRVRWMIRSLFPKR